MDGTQTGFLDTLSLHMSVGGISNQQRPDYKTWKRARVLHESAPDECTEAMLRFVLIDADTFHGRGRA